jgi:hypothetical protein
MSEQEEALAQQEAKARATETLSSSERARLWAGMNRYLAAEAAHAHRANQPEEPARPGDTDG